MLYFSLYNYLQLCLTALLGTESLTHVRTCLILHNQVLPSTLNISNTDIFTSTDILLCEYHKFECALVKYRGMSFRINAGHYLTKRSIKDHSWQ